MECERWPSFFSEVPLFRQNADVVAKKVSSWTRPAMDFIGRNRVGKNLQTENIVIMIQTELLGNFRLNMNIMLEMGDDLYLLDLSFDIKKFAHHQLFFFWNSLPTCL